MFLLENLDILRKKIRGLQECSNGQCMWELLSVKELDPDDSITQPQLDGIQCHQQPGIADLREQNT